MNFAPTSGHGRHEQNKSPDREARNADNFAPQWQTRRKGKHIPKAREGPQIRKLPTRSSISNSRQCGVTEATEHLRSLWIGRVSPEHISKRLCQPYGAPGPLQLLRQAPRGNICAYPHQASRVRTNSFCRSLEKRFRQPQGLHLIRN